MTLETPEQARKRKAAGGAKPEIYVPPPPEKTSGAQKVRYGSIAAEPERIRGPLQADVD